MKGKACVFVLAFAIKGLWPILSLFASVLYGQEGCGSATYIKRLGDITSAERGLSLAYSAVDNAIYIVGSKDDSLSIIKLNLNDDIEWIRNFDIVKQKGDHAHKIIVDSEGMLVIAGTAGQFNVLGEVFAFRYDPNANTVIWSKRYLSYNNCFNHGLEELTPGGYFLMSNNPSVSGNNDEQILFLDRQTGDIIPQRSFHIDLGDSEALNDVILHEGFLYGNGRYTDGPDFRDMRNTTTKIDPATGASIWTLLGHVSATASARLYGAGLVIDQGEIFSISVGDENGTSVNDTEIWIQKTNLEGQVKWINKYELPGTGDWVDEIISSDGGFVVLAKTREAPGYIYLIKIDRDGNVLWAKRFNLAQKNFSLVLGGIQGPLQQIGDHLYFTAFSEQGIDEDLILVKTDLNGNVSDSCGFVTDAQIIVTPVNNPVFYFVEPVVFNYHPDVISDAPVATAGTVSPLAEICFSPGDIQSAVVDTICPGTAYEGYTQAGTYIDTLITISGCDSIRTLTLHIRNPEMTFFSSAICAGHSIEGYQTSGIFIDTFVSVYGCDSIRTLALEVYPPMDTMLEKSICTGNSYEGYVESGIYTDVFTSAIGCDSIRTLQLNVMDTILTERVESVCPGQSIEGYQTSGIFIDTFVSVYGCDSIRTLALEVYPPMDTMLEKSICTGNSFEGYVESGVYTDVFTSAMGCDSIRTLQLNVMDTIRTERVESVCHGQSIDGYFSTGIYADTFSTQFGCDSIRLLHLMELEASESYQEVPICDESSAGYSSPGVYIDTLVSHLGCDSIHTLVVINDKLYIPNVFSPNGDGINDEFEVITSPDQEMQFDYFALFDRYGNMVYTTDRSAIKWDGRDKKGRMYNPGVFTWVMRWTCQGETKRLGGNVTLVR